MSAFILSILVLLLCAWFVFLFVCFVANNFIQLNYIYVALFLNVTKTPHTHHFFRFNFFLIERKTIFVNEKMNCKYCTK